MNEETKAFELKDEQLEQVNGGEGLLSPTHYSGELCHTCKVGYLVYDGVVPAKMIFSSNTSYYKYHCPHCQATWLSVSGPND